MSVRVGRHELILSTSNDGMFIGSIHKKNVDKDYIEVPLLRLIKSLRCRDFEKYNCSY
jgi:hypothetical protein